MPRAWGSALFACRTVYRARPATHPSPRGSPGLDRSLPRPVVTPETPETPSAGSTHACRVATRPFGVLADGRPVSAFTLANGNGVEAELLDYGGIIVALRVPDRDGAVADVVLGYDTLAAYERQRYYLGALVGRYANRIARGRFTLDGAEHRLATNDGPNHLHGGPGGFHAVLWRAEPFVGEGGAGVTLTYESPSGEEGYPGRLVVCVAYTLTPRDELIVEYRATADRATPVNLTQHSYFNLAGHDAGSTLAHELTVAASRFTPVDQTLIPTGELRPVEGSPFDFRSPVTLGARLPADDEQLRLGHGYDHNLVLDGPAGDAPAFAARLHDPASGRVLEVHTTEPGLQLYGGQGLRGVEGKGGHVYPAYAGVALETQHFPDSPNQPAFPSTILRPGEVYVSRTDFRFRVAPPSTRTRLAEAGSPR